MSTAQRFAWLDGISTVGVCGAAMALLPPAEPPTATWGIAARVAIVTIVCIVAFYYNDLYNFEVPLGGGPLVTELARQIRTRPDLALRLVGAVGPAGSPVAGPHLGDYSEVVDVV